MSTFVKRLNVVVMSVLSRIPEIADGSDGVHHHRKMTTTSVLNRDGEIIPVQLLRVRCKASTGERTCTVVR